MEQRCKKYVEVVADFSPDGELMPLRVIWDDGEWFVEAKRNVPTQQT